MAAEGTYTKTSVHIRSNSFPSARHPLVSQFEEHLQRLKASEATSSSTSSAINHKLNGLQDLHDYIDKLLQLPITQKALARDCCNELLEGSLRLLDICGTAKDALLQSKDSIHELQSDVRRSRGSENTFTIASGKYLTSKKKVKKAILKTLRNLKQIKNEFIVPPSNKDNETLSMLRTLKEAKQPL